MKKFTKSKVGIAALLVTLTVVAISAVGAYAYFTKGGLGTGTATAGQTTALSVTQTSTVSGLYPGGTPAALSGTFTNPNESPVYTDGLVATVGTVTPFRTDGPNPCTAADFVIAGSTGAQYIPSGNSSWSGLTLQMIDNGHNQNNCKGATVAINYSIGQPVTP